MNIKVIEEDFVVCKVEDLSQVNYNDKFCFIGKTDEELSLVCTEKSLPSNTIEVDKGWKCFRIEGILDFSLIGILSKITTILAENNIGVFAVSTYNTDYVMVKSTCFDLALQILKRNNYEII